MKQNQKGFTLIELLVVVAIIGLLASVIVVSLNSARAKARDAKRIADMRAVQGALELYYGDKAAYPASATTSVATNLWTTSYPDITDTSLAAYMPAVPLPPSVDNATACGTKTYRYAVSTDKANYALQFCLSAATGNYTAGLNYLSNSGGISATAPTAFTPSPVW